MRQVIISDALDYVEALRSGRYKKCKKEMMKYVD
jgi:hypothetical protein